MKNLLFFSLKFIATNKISNELHFIEFGFIIVQKFHLVFSKIHSTPDFCNWVLTKI